MAASQYLVILPEVCGRTLINGADRFVVVAESTADAKDIVKDYFSGDSDALVAAATVTALAAAADYEGFTLRVQINDPTTPIDASYTAVAADTIDLIGAGIKAALIAAGVAGADYNSTTQVVTAAAIADNLGDNQLVVDFTGPNGNAPIASYVSSIVDGGIAGAALTFTLPADSRTIPTVVAALKS